MRLGIYGGTFDPVHYGHLLLAEQCREQSALDEVWFVPAAAPPHKENVEITSAKHRVNMLDFAVAGCPELKICELELERGGVSYTVDTLQQLSDEDPSRELFLLVGMDSLLDLPTWREPERILQLATVVAVNRRSQHSSGAEQSALSACRQITPAAEERIELAEMPDIDISATDIRSRVRAGKSIRFLTPRPVAMYIAEHGLYL
jgi:nicotinate-nucleotide adenylyltransferase